MKHVIKALAVAALVSVLASCGGGKYTDGVYSGSSMAGMHGEFALEMVIENGKIVEIHPTVNNETPGIGTSIIDPLFQAIIAEQTADVDAVSGASKTSAAILEAAADALSKAAK